MPPAAIVTVVPPAAVCPYVAASLDALPFARLVILWLFIDTAAAVAFAVAMALRSSVEGSAPAWDAVIPVSAAPDPDGVR